MSDAKRMIQCDHIECGGQEQPHSFDNGIGEWDCDGPCSPRRVQAWKDKQTKVIEDEQAARPRVYDMFGRSVMLHPLHRDCSGECSDCGAPAKVVVIEDNGKAWLWCDMCQVGG